MAAGQSSPLLTLSPELQDMILAECYKKLTVTGEQLRTRSKTRTKGRLVFGIESTCKALRRRSLVVRALPFHRTMTVESPEAFAAMVPHLQSREKLAWICAGLTCIRFRCICDTQFGFHSADIDWGTLLTMCSGLRDIKLDGTYTHEDGEHYLQKFLPADSDEGKRELARFAVQADFYLDYSLSEHLCGPSGLLHGIAAALHAESGERGLQFEAVLTTIVTDENDDHLCDVITKCVWREGSILQKLQGSTHFVTSKKCVVGAVEESVDFEQDN